MKSFCLTIFLMLPFAAGLAQDRFRAAEDSLRFLAVEMQRGKDAFVRMSACSRFSVLLYHTLRQEDAFQYPFDSLTTVSRLQSDDGVLRVFTWVVRRDDGGFDPWGMLQVRQKKGRKVNVYPLTDHSAEIVHPESRILSPETWFGALYYQLLTRETKGKTLYTLLGWIGTSTLVRQKIIEVVTVSSSGKVSFGGSYFPRFTRKVKRVLFSYGQQTSMSLNFSEQLLSIRKKKGKKWVTEKVPAGMIVFDRLVPSQPGLEGHFQFYVAETNVLDAFWFRDGKWQFVRDVDARNPERPDPLKPGKKVELELFPEKGPEKN